MFTTSILTHKFYKFQQFQIASICYSQILCQIRAGEGRISFHITRHRSLFTQEIPHHTTHYLQLYTFIILFFFCLCLNLYFSLLISLLLSPSPSLFTPHVFFPDCPYSLLKETDKHKELNALYCPVSIHWSDVSAWRTVVCVLTLTPFYSSSSRTHSFVCNKDFMTIYCNWPRWLILAVVRRLGKSAEVITH